jgi:preprotein translocase subunit SecD
VNRFPVWKYALVALCVAVASFYTLPNFFGESPAIQISSLRTAVRVDPALLQRVESALSRDAIRFTGAVLDAGSVRVRFSDTDTQLKGKDAVDKALNPDAQDPGYVVALNLLPSSPRWLAALGALPMYLGLDLRGGVHFLLQVDMPAALTKRLESLTGDIRSLLREKSIRHGGVAREGQTLRVRFRDAESRDKARAALDAGMSDLTLAERISV